MKKIPPNPDPMRLATPPSRTEYGALCVSALVAPWSDLTALDGNSRLQADLADELARTPCVRAFSTKNCSEGSAVATQNSFTEEVVLATGRSVASSGKLQADMLWLGKKQAFIDTTNGRLLFLARAGKICLAGRYTHHSAAAIATCFKWAMTDPKEIEVVGFFGLTDGSPFVRFSEECKAAGITKTVRHEVSIPPAGYFSYKTHPDPKLAKMSSLGIVYRR